MLGVTELPVSEHIALMTEKGVIWYVTNKGDGTIEILLDSRHRSILIEPRSSNSVHIHLPKK